MLFSTLKVMKILQLTTLLDMDYWTMHRHVNTCAASITCFIVPHSPDIWTLLLTVSHAGCWQLSMDADIWCVWCMSGVCWVPFPDTDIRTWVTIPASWHNQLSLYDVCKPPSPDADIWTIVRSSASQLMTTSPGRGLTLVKHVSWLLTNLPGHGHVDVGQVC